MKILFITKLLPFPLDIGARIKTHTMLKYLSRNHDIVLFSLIHYQDEVRQKEKLSNYCREIRLTLVKRSIFRNISCFLLSMFSKRPFLIKREYSKKAQDIVNEILKNNSFDIIYVDHLHMAQYINSQPIKKILDEHNVEWSLIQRYLEAERDPLKKLVAFIEYRKMEKYEISECHKFDMVLTLTERDRGILEKSGLKNISCIPLGIDTKELSPLRQNPDAKDIVFLGAMHWPPNIDAVRWFYKEIFQLVRQDHPDVKLIIIGKNPPWFIRRLARDKNVEVLGFVKDPREHLKDCAAFIVPIRIGGGMRIKLLSALAWGLPIVSTTIGAEGIDVTDNKDILISDDPKSFARSVIKLINDKDIRVHLSKNARILAETQYDLDVSFRKLSVVAGL